MVDINKMMNKIIKIKPTRNNSVRKKMNQSTILSSNGMDEVEIMDTFLRDHSKYGDKWNEVVEENNIWNEEWDLSELSVSKHDKLEDLAKKFIKKYNLSEEYKKYKHETKS